MFRSKNFSFFIGGALAIAGSLTVSENVSHAVKKTTHVTTTTNQSHTHTQTETPVAGDGKFLTPSESDATGYRFRSDIVPPITRGHWQVGGEITFSNFWYQSFSRLDFSVDMPVEYFIMDYLSVGGTVGLSHTSLSPGLSGTNGSFGPSATVYFWKDGPLVAYGSLKATYLFLDYAEDAIALTPAVGARYFLTSSVAAGPELSFTHNFGMGTRHASNGIAIGATFSLFL